MTYLEYQRGAVNPGDCIGNAWNLVTAKFWLYVGMGAVTFLLISCIPLLNMLLIGPVLGGFYYVALRDMRGEPVEFGMLFKGFEKFVPLMVVGLIQAIPGLILQIVRFTVDMGQFAGGARRGTGSFFQSSGPGAGILAGLSVFFIIVIFVFAIFSIFWNLSLQMAIPIILENDIGVVDAIKLSVGSFFGNIGGLIVLAILSGFVALVGVLALCVGIFVAFPVIYAAIAFAYRQIFPWRDGQFNYSPPPPTAYGDFGRGMQS